MPILGENATQPGSIKLFQNLLVPCTIIAFANLPLSSKVLCQVLPDNGPSRKYSLKYPR